MLENESLTLYIRARETQIAPDGEKSSVNELVHAKTKEKDKDKTKTKNKTQSPVL